MDPPSDSADPFAESLRWARALVQLIPDHFPGHPMVDWYVGITNALGEYDLPYHGVLHRFRRGKQTAYLWLDDGAHFSPWHPECRPGRTVHRAESVAEALDQLAAAPNFRPWWQFWR